ncbi:hypothetical protein BN874_130060 [Candidatus Contendobacter odensis Run_B_J11]|uniref:Uncharacterized protein n=1 Tax=Candidatus Contendobacter odensis Run_B_J11 TaxID=1400861 RepID=A0A7U7G915_9GAMM|nr:hypothetical protein BN874_130060 [Candidatus Contendobacter odensis Run_B_J11]
MNTESLLPLAIWWRRAQFGKSRDENHAEHQESPVFGAASDSAGSLFDPDHWLRHLHRAGGAKSGGVRADGAPLGGGHARHHSGCP